MCLLSRSILEYISKYKKCKSIGVGVKATYHCMEMREHLREKTKVNNYYYVYLLCRPPPTSHVSKTEEAKIKVLMMVNFPEPILDKDYILRNLVIYKIIVMNFQCFKIIEKLMWEYDSVC